jgi:hypothetical protein
MPASMPTNAVANEEQGGGGMLFTPLTEWRGRDEREMEGGEEGGSWS